MLSPMDRRSGGRVFFLWLASILITVVTAAAALAAAPGTVEAPPEREPQLSSPAKIIEAVRVDDTRLVLAADGAVGPYKTFTLPNPPRLVIDLPDLRPGFTARRFDIGNGFRQLRVGTEKDRTRFVLDAAGGAIPAHEVEAVGRELIVSWGEQGSTAAPTVRPVEVEAVDFAVENGQSLLTVTLSAPTEVIDPVAEGTSVRFGVHNARISRALRRTIDASSFPSSVLRVTPYLVTGKEEQEVRFAVELKGDVPYSLQKEGKLVRFVAQNQQFAEPSPPAAEVVKVPVPAPPAGAGSAPAAPAPAPGTADKAAAMAARAVEEPTEQPRAVRPAGKTGIVSRTGDGPAYRGEKISLIFDDANIRNILQLIGEVSHLNIIAGEDVKGTITLRLIDVPWDQALDLILETKGLGMLREGNVVRIMPQEQIRARRQAELAAVREERQLEPLVTEIIPISYTDLGNIAGPARELLTERGKITQDARNKQIIVTDVPSAIAEVRRLTAILDTPERQVMIEARIVEANSTFTRDLGVKWGISYENDGGGPHDVSQIRTGLGGSFLISPPATGAALLGGAGLGSGITFGRVGIDSTVLDLRISALESSGHGKVISTPRVSTLNGGEATISQGTKIPYQSSDENGVSKTEFVDANLELRVKPVINPDNSIILDIQASNSSPTTVEGATAPAISTKDAKTKLLVRDGETTVIGGIFVESEDQSEAGVPLLMRVPILGHLFKSQSSSKTRSELLVFITPRIVSTR